MFSEGGLEWLRERVNRLCPDLSEEEWDAIGPEWAEPYSDADVDEIVGRYVKLKGITAPGRRRRTKKSPTQKEAVQLSPRARWLHARPLLQDWRRDHGFASPIKFEELRQTLTSLGATTDKQTVRDDSYGWHGAAHALPYPSTIKPLGTIATLYEIEQVYFSVHNVKLFYFKEYTDFLALHLHCHPALALSAWLCDMPLYDNTNIIFEGHTLKLEIASLHAIQPKSVMKAYSVGQREILNLTGNKTSKRRGSDRTRALCFYPMVTPGLTWQQRWVRWNSKHPEWKYSDVQTMVSAYSRVKRKRDANIAWLEEIERRLGMTSWDMNISGPMDIGRQKERTKEAKEDETD